MKHGRRSTSSFCKFILALPLLMATCFVVNPLRAENTNLKLPASIDQLSQFEGYYRLETDSNLYLQILVKNNKLVLKELWDNREITFEQKSDLSFYNDEASFPLAFSKNAKGEITEVLAFDRDNWIKVKGYKPVVKKEIMLSAEKMKAFAGKYRIGENGEERFLQFTVKGNTLEVAESWTDRVYTIVPESELSFFGKDIYYPVQFSKDKNGNVSQALIFNRDIWVKVKD
jgi:uncharacterized protein YjhX (UPF0386 family)